jgi:hypothetical protein
LQRLMTAELIDTTVQITILRGATEVELFVRPAELDSARRAR